jgi:DNA replicative helicase MCM subunit Mcm2 (Cdc46/Mcm family)
MEKLLVIKETSVFYLVISAEDLFSFDSEMYYYLIKYPAETILLFDQIVNKVYIQ